MGYTHSGPRPEAVRPAWRAHVVGRVTAQALVVRGTIYVVTTAGRVYAFAPNGNVRWTADVGSGIAYSSARDSLYVVTGNAFDGGENTGDSFREYAGFGEHLR